jgi:hypothetical protein
MKDYKYHKIKILAFTLLTLLAIKISAAPAAKDYQIELIVFKFNNSDDVYKETWPNAQLNIPANAIELTDDFNDSNNYYFKLLSKEQLKYTNESAKINNNSRYKVIAHMGWIQSKKDLLLSKPIHITAGRMFNNQIPEINGIINFNLKKYVHVNFDLILNLPARATNDINKPFALLTNDNLQDNNIYLQSFAINEQRRLKNKELNYFDNPAFGAILIVNELNNKA